MESLFAVKKCLAETDDVGFGNETFGLIVRDPNGFASIGAKRISIRVCEAMLALACIQTVRAAVGSSPSFNGSCEMKISVIRIANREQGEFRWR